MASRAYTIEGRPVGQRIEQNHTTTGPGDPVKFDELPVDLFSLQVFQVSATISTWSVTLEGSIDGTNWFVLITHSNTGDTLGDIKALSGIPVNYVRHNVGTLTGGGTLGVAWNARTSL